jgi:hypothetical protein
LYKMISFFDLPNLSELEAIKNICIDHTEERKKQWKLRELVIDIQRDLFVDKFKGPVLDPEILKEVEYFYDISNKIKQKGTEPIPISLYRAVRPSKNYSPDELKIGETMENILPFSTSIDPEFPVYIWNKGAGGCCIFKINLEISPDLNMICLQSISKEKLFRNMFMNDPEYQSEITLPPGLFIVTNIHKLKVPSKDEYRRHYSHIYPFLSTIVSKDPEDFQDFEMTLIEVNYTPYSVDEFKTHFLKYVK